MASEEPRGELGAVPMVLWSLAAWVFWFGLAATGLAWWLRLAVAVAVVLALAGRPEGRAGAAAPAGAAR